jgi:hypothetical protein
MGRALRFQALRFCEDWRFSWVQSQLAKRNGHDRLASPGNENRADETNPIPAFQSGIREHEESMTSTIFSEEANFWPGGLSGPGMPGPYEGAEVFVLGPTC